MTILSIAQAATGRIGLLPPSTLIGNTDATAVQILALLNEEVLEQTTKPWQVLKAQANWVSLATEAQGSISTLFPNMLSITNDTLWNRSLKRPIFGPLSAQQYAQNKAFYQTGPWSQYYIEQGIMMFYPAPVAGQAIWAEYQTNLVANLFAGGQGSAFVDDRDSCIVDEEMVTLGIIWRFKAAKGLEYAEDVNKYENRRDDLLARDATKPVLNLDGTGFDILPGIFVPAGSWSVP